MLAIAAFVVLSVPLFVYSTLRIRSKDKDTTLDDVGLVGLWARTIASMNSTFNCLIFYWKNKTLRTEGMKVVKSIKLRRKVPQSGHTERSRKQERSEKQRKTISEFEEEHEV